MKTEPAIPEKKTKLQILFSKTKDIAF